MVTPRKTDRRWNPEKARRWGFVQKTRNAQRKRAEMVEMGTPPGGSASGGGPGPSGTMAGGPGPGTESNNREPHPGDYDGPKSTTQTPEEETTTEREPPLIDLEGMWSSLPDFLKMMVLGLQNWADAFNWYQDKIYITFIPLNDKEARTLADFARPYLEKKLPDFVRHNPGLAILMVPVFIFLFKVKISFRKPRDMKTARVIDVTVKSGQEGKAA